MKVHYMGGSFMDYFYIWLYNMAKNIESESKLSLEEEVSLIFKSVFQKSVAIKPKTFVKIREVMKHNAQQLLEDSLKRAVRRDSNLNTVQLPDLLWAINRRGQKYKIKIGKSLITANSFNEFGDRKFMMNYQDDVQNLQQPQK